MPTACMSSSSAGRSSEVVEKLKKPIVETLSSQIKRMALSAYSHCNPCRRHPEELQPRTGSFSVGVELDKFRRSNCSSTAGKKELEGKVTPAAATDRRVNPLVFEEESQPKEWVAQVERGVLFTFLSLPGGNNELKRIRFSKEMFDKRKADKWWAENSENLMELYNVKGQTLLHGPNECTTPSSDIHSMQSASSTHHCGIFSTPTTLRRDSDSAEWVEQDEPGVYITIRALPDGRRGLRCIRFRFLWASRDVRMNILEKFNVFQKMFEQTSQDAYEREQFRENEARLWWEENRERINKQYL